jgi:hypothetical protein
VKDFFRYLDRRVAAIRRLGFRKFQVTDDQPHIEYATWVCAKEISRVLPALLDLSVAPPLVNANAGFVERLNAYRQLQFYRASLHAYDGDRDGWARDIREVLKGDGKNPYYRWFVGERSMLERKTAFFIHRHTEDHNGHLTDVVRPAKLHRASTRA